MGFCVPYVTIMSTSQIAIQDFCAAIYCAECSWAEFGLDEGSNIHVVLNLIDAGSRHRLQVSFEQVSDFRQQSDHSDRPPPGPTDRLELSAVELEGRPGEWRFWTNPWYLHEIEFRCRNIMINGHEVAGQGRGFQDELPLSRPSL